MVPSKMNKIFRLFFLMVFVFTVFNVKAQSADAIEENLGLAHEIYSSNPDSSYALCCQAEDEAKKTSASEHTGEIALCKTRYLILVTDYQNAALELSKALRFFEQNNDFSRLSYTYSLQSILYERIGEPEAAMQTLLNAYEISLEHNDYVGQVNRLTNITLTYIRTGQADSAYFYLLELIELDKYIDDESRYFLEQNQGLYYSLIGDYNKAMYYYGRAKEISIAYGMVDSKATILVLIAEAYRNLGMLNEAEQSVLESYDWSVANRLVFEERDAIKEAVTIYELQRDFENAFEFQQKLFDVDVRINEIEKIRKLKEEEYHRSLAEKEKQIVQAEYSLQEEKLSAERARARNMSLYFVVGIILLVLFFIVFIYLRTRKLNRAIQLSKIILEQKNKEIIDSITYAKRIQDAILPPRSVYQQLFKEVFVMYRPKDIVAGDFYWFTEQGEDVFFAVADCTGHGVPGAMVSVICHSALERSVKEFGFRRPAEILEKTSELVVETFMKSEREVKDGMDIALCVFNRKTGGLLFAGANNAVWIIRKKMDGQQVLQAVIADERNMLIELRGDKRPIGHSAVRRSFTDQEIILQNGDAVYMSTDGYFDQFGGEKGKKFKSKAFKEKLLQVQVHELTAQHEMITEVFDRWKGDLEQVDDVCVMGIRI